MAQKEDKINCSKSQYSGFLSDIYLERTSRPIFAVVFLLPLIIFYEIGTILINTDLVNFSQIRVIAFAWLQNLTEYLGFSSRFAWIVIPMIVVVVLFAMQITSGKKWSFRFKDILPTAVECTILAVPLIVLSLLLNSLMAGGIKITPENNQPELQVRTQTESTFDQGFTDDADTAGILDNMPGKAHPLMVEIVTGIGAGIYEELVFRLILICLLMLVFQNLLGIRHASALILSVLISAALFSAHHHIFFLNGQFDRAAAFAWPQFTFRTIAGVYFSSLFAVRGFAVTAGTHAVYDIIAAVTNAVFFTS